MVGAADLVDARRAGGEPFLEGQLRLGDLEAQAREVGGLRGDHVQAPMSASSASASGMVASSLLRARTRRNSPTVISVFIGGAVLRAQRSVA
jgi:hypothetical protein